MRRRCSPFAAFPADAKRFFSAVVPADFAEAFTATKAMDTDIGAYAKVSCVSRHVVVAYIYTAIISNRKTNSMPVCVVYRA